MNFFGIIALCSGIVIMMGTFVLEGGHLASLFQFSAFLIVMGGTFCAVALQSTPKQLITGLRMGIQALNPKKIDFQKSIADVTSWSQNARRNGLLSLESTAQNQTDPLVKKALQMLTDGAEPDSIRSMSDTEIGLFEHQQKQAIKVWESAAGYAPTMGILGAVLGLIHVLENLSDPTRLGPGIAIAFVATVYGVGFANLIFLPIANRLKNELNIVATHKEMVTEGIIAIAEGENPKLIETRLQSFLAIDP